MQVGDIIKIKGTNTFWDDKQGKVEAIDNERNVATILVDFIPEENKRIRQDFSLNALSSSEIIEEAYRNKQTNEVGDIEKDFNNGFVLFKSDLGKSQVSKDDLEEIDDKIQNEVMHLQQAPSFEKDLDDLDASGRFKEFEWLFDEEGGSVGILRLKGLNEAIKCERVEVETRSVNKSVSNPNNITVYALKKGRGSGNQFRAYFFRSGNTCIFVRGHIKKQTRNGNEEYKCIQDVIDYATK